MSDPRTVKFPGSGPMPETLQAARGCWVPRPFEALHPDERSDTYMNRYEPTHQSSVNKNVAVVSRREPSMVQQENQGLRCLLEIGAPVIPVIPVAQYPTPAMAPRLERNCNQAATFASPIGWRPGTPVVNPFLLLQQLAGAQVF